MSQRRLRYPANTNIRDLPGKVMLLVQRALDTRAIDNVSAWRVFAARLKGHYAFKAQDVERFAQQVHRGSSPSSQMLLELGAKAMDMNGLVRALSDMELEDVLTELIDSEDVQIILQPEPYVKVQEGERAVLTVRARGFPYPRYLWYRFDPKSDDSVATTHSDATLVIEKARVEDSGDYCCLAYNTSRTGVFTEWATITVQTAPKPENFGIPLPVSSQVIHPMIQSQIPGKADPVYTIPHIVQQPWPVNVHVGAPVRLLCEAQGHLPLTYKWLRNGQIISSMQTGYLKIDKSKLDDDGAYQCVVSNDFGTAKSNCVIVSVAANSWECFAPASLVPEIQEHPKSCVVQLGGHAIFRCIAHGQGNLKYQWFKDCDSIPGATENEYRLYDIKNRGMQGLYMCLVSNDNGAQVLSKGAILQIGDISYKPHHTATDKLALLIGNYDYRSQQSLKAPQTDIQNLSHIFQHLLGFKVVSLLNLTRTEMISAVEEFCELIDSGVYCVFYFCGHGFEENNHSYILPNDVPTDYKTEECLSAEFVLRKMQQRHPKICCMILDICRKPAENPSQNQRTAVLEHAPVEDGNTVVCYATSIGLSAYETRVKSVKKEAKGPSKTAHGSENTVRKTVAGQSRLTGTEEETWLKQHVKTPGDQGNILRKRDNVMGMAELLSHRDLKQPEALNVKQPIKTAIDKDVTVRKIVTGMTELLSHQDLKQPEALNVKQPIKTASDKDVTVRKTMTGMTELLSHRDLKQPEALIVKQSIKTASDKDVTVRKTVTGSAGMRSEETYLKQHMRPAADKDTTLRKTAAGSSGLAGSRQKVQSDETNLKQAVGTAQDSGSSQQRNRAEGSCGLAAFEFRPESKGILVTHLEKLLPQPLSIEEVFRRVKEAVGNDNRVNRNSQTRQFPEVRSNLTEVHRSFTDPIETSGHTRACNQRQLAWENAHVKPPPMEVCLHPEELGVVVELTFQHEFSNVLNVFVKVKSKGTLSDCIAWISKLPSSVSMMKKPICVSPEGAEFTVTKNVIIDIQKLKENLRVSLAMRYRQPGSPPYNYIYSKDTQVDLQMPLVAGLKLWSPRPTQSPPRRAVEQTEEDKVVAEV